MNIQKRLAAQITKSSAKRIKFSNDRLADIKEAITKADIRQLMAEGAITRLHKKGVSRARARHLKRQKAKGLRSGPGTRKGRETSRQPAKKAWIHKIRSQREFLKELKEKQAITNKTFRDTYLKAKGGYFRSTRHIRIFLEDNKLFLKQGARTSGAGKKEEKKEETRKPRQEKTKEANEEKSRGESQ
jgi:large subunit ribosomal protein L19e